MKKLAKEILSGLEDALAYAQGDKTRGVETIVTVSKINVKAIRQKTGLTQEAFSQLFAIKVRTLQDWEQHRRNPSIAARIFLSLIDQHPSTVKKTLKSLGYPLKSSVGKSKAISKPKVNKSSRKIEDPRPIKNKLRLR